MKIPYSPVGQTQPSSRGLRYLEDSSGLAARGLQDFASALGSIGETLAAKDAQAQTFKANLAYDESLISLNEKATELYRSADPSDTTVRERAEALYDNTMGQFLSTIPPALQEEYRAKVSGAKVQFLAGTLEFDSKIKDNWYRTGLGDKFTRLQVEVSKAWDDASVDARIREAHEAIDKSGLAEQEKVQLKYETTQTLLQEQYKQIRLNSPVIFDSVRISPTTKALVPFVQRAENVAKDPRAISSAGAIGLMQVTPRAAIDVARVLGDRKFLEMSPAAQAEFLKNPNNNMLYGATYLDMMVRTFDGDVEAALIAYNAGEGNARKWLESGRDYSALPKRSETEPYVKKILGWAKDVKAEKPRGGRIPIVTGTQPGRQPVDMSGLKSEVVDKWERVQGAFGRAVPIVSAFRDPERNAKAGGAKKSRHLHGDAIDVDVSNMSNADRRRLIETASAMGFTGIGVYKNSLHFDLGNRRVWGPSHSKDSVPSWAFSATSKHLAGVIKSAPNDADVELSPSGGFMSPDDNPRFASIPVNFRESIANDVAGLQRQRIAAESQAEKDRKAAYVEQFRKDIYNGNKGLRELEAAWDNGEIDASDFYQMKGDYDKRTQTDDTLANARNALARGETPSATQLDALANADGVNDGLVKRTKEAAEAVATLAHRVNDLAPSSRDILTNMFTSLDPQNAAYALKTAALLQNNSAIAFSKLPESVRNGAALFSAMVGSGKSDLAAAQAIIGDGTPETRRKIEETRDFGRKLYNSSTFKGQEKAQKTLKSMLDPWGPNNPDMRVNERVDFLRWYENWWVENFAKLGDESLATQATDEFARTQWQVSNVGGLPTLMQWAPEAVGAPKVDTGNGPNYDWMTEVAREQLGLKPGEKFIPIADAVTRQQIAEWQSGGLRPGSMVDKIKKGVNDLFGREVLREEPAGPTWKVLIMGEDGVPRLSDDPNRRISFQPTEEQLQRQRDVVDVAQLKAMRDRAFEEYQNEMAERVARGEAPDKVVEDFKNNVRALDERYGERFSEVYPDRVRDDYLPEISFDDQPGEDAGIGFETGRTPTTGVQPDRRIDTTGPKDRKRLTPKGGTEFSEEDIKEVMELWGVPRTEALQILRNYSTTRPFGDQ